MRICMFLQIFFWMKKVALSQGITVVWFQGGIDNKTNNYLVQLTEAVWIWAEKEGKGRKGEEGMGGIQGSWECATW